MVWIILKKVFLYVTESTVSHPEYFDLINPMFIAEAFMNILCALLQL